VQEDVAGLTSAGLARPRANSTQGEQFSRTRRRNWEVRREGEGAIWPKGGDGRLGGRLYRALRAAVVPGLKGRAEGGKKRRHRFFGGW
jgi:hypothetical protein